MNELPSRSRPDGSESFEQINQRLLLDSYERLGEFIRMGLAPMVASEVALLVRRVACVYGPQVFTQLGTFVIEVERERRGFCTLCPENPAPVVRDNMCEQCIAESERRIAEHEAPATEVEP